MVNNTNLSEQYRRLAELNKLIEVVKGNIPNYPKGNLRISQGSTGPKYYQISEKGGTNGRYIKRENFSLARDLGQREYEESVLKAATREQKAIEDFLKKVGQIPPEEIFSRLSIPRQKILEPVAITDEQYSQEWQNTPFDGNPFEPERREIPTKRGDMVRTKSEAFIADMYFALKIPYKYEYPLELSNGLVKYPDFTLLKLPERKIIYHEHMGMMDKEEYRQKNIAKLRDYTKSGIFTGENLILTFEADYAPLNVFDIEKMIRLIFFGEKVKSE